MSRFDLTKTQREFVNFAVLAGVVDAVDLLVFDFSGFVALCGEIFRKAEDISLAQGDPSSAVKLAKLGLLGLEEAA